MEKSKRLATRVSTTCERIFLDINTLDRLGAFNKLIVSASVSPGLFFLGVVGSVLLLSNGIGDMIIEDVECLRLRAIKDDGVCS